MTNAEENFNATKRQFYITSDLQGKFVFYYAQKHWYKSKIKVK